LKPSSAKAKGRRACQELKEKLLKAYPELEDGDIVVTPSGVNGEDLQMSPLAKKTIPLTFEVKNQERLNIWKAIDQSKTHIDTGDKRKPVVAFKRNNSRMYLTIDVEDFLELFSRDLEA
jgi:hypothetical protein